MVDRAAATLKFRPTLRSRARCGPLVSDDVAPHLLAVLGEALSNASRHAEAQPGSRSASVPVTASASSSTDDGGGHARGRPGERSAQHP